jgi:hypothetical protein
MLVGVEGDRGAMTLEITAQGLEVRTCAFAGNEAQLHQLARSIIDEDQQGTRRCTIFEPAMFAAIDLDQLAVMLTSQAWLMKAPTLFARQPHAFGRHPTPERLTPHTNIMSLRKVLRG